MSAEQTKNMVFEPTTKGESIVDVLGGRGILTTLISCYPGCAEAIFDEAENVIKVSVELRKDVNYSLSSAARGIEGYIRQQARIGTVRSTLREVR